jgi:hypothetical protein
VSGKRSTLKKASKLTSSSALAICFTAKARTLPSSDPGPSSSRASSIPTSVHNGSKTSTACLASAASDQVTDFKNFVRDRLKVLRENR